MTGEFRSGELHTRVRGILEEELGEFRPFADLPVSEIEAMAAKLIRALEPVLANLPGAEAQRSAA